MSSPAGYADAAYAATLGHVGVPQRLPRSGGSILVRTIPDTSDVDAVGPYPLFSCADWNGLEADVRELDGLVTLAVVPDPFGSWTAAELEAVFPDRCAPFKEHFVVDLSRRPMQSATRHHRREVARALRKVTVEEAEHPMDFLDEWSDLYAELVRRHTITGAAAFPRASFADQFAVSGLRVFRATDGRGIVGGALWFVDRGVAHYHLTASSNEGYRLGASYALVASALEQFAAEGLAWASLGAGLDGRAASGLAVFKQGWSTGTRTVYFCGRVFDRARYTELTQRLSSEHATYFPAYRSSPG